jgi:hypothetical protein
MHFENWMYAMRELARPVVAVAHASGDVANKKKQTTKKNKKQQQNQQSGEASNGTAVAVDSVLPFTWSSDNTAAATTAVAAAACACESELERKLTAAHVDAAQRRRVHAQLLAALRRESDALALAHVKQTQTGGIASPCKVTLQPMALMSAVSAKTNKTTSPPSPPLTPSSLVSVSCSDVVVNVTYAHYQRLRAAYRRNAARAPSTSISTTSSPGSVASASSSRSLSASASSSDSAASTDVHVHALAPPDEAELASLFCLLLRYLSLAGGVARGGAMQGALHSAVFDVLRRGDFGGVQMECFASPLNCHHQSFCSACVDTDAAYGSIGDFFTHFRPLTGAYEANPPFDAQLIDRMRLRMESLLSISRRAFDAATAEKVTGKVKQSLYLSFVVVMPRWPQRECWHA